MKKVFVGTLMVMAALLLALPMAAQDNPPPYLGIAFQPDGQSGLIVMEVVPGSPAAAADIELGDVVVSVDDMAVGAMNIREVLGEYAPGDTVSVLVLRDSESVLTEVTLEEQDPTLSFMQGPSQTDLFETLRGLRLEEPRPRLGIAVDSPEAGAGALVLNVVPDSPADEAGIQAGDVIMAVNGDAVENTTALVEQISTRQADEIVTLTLMREDETIDVDVTVEMSLPRAFVSPMPSNQAR